AAGCNGQHSREDSPYPWFERSAVAAMGDTFRSCSPQTLRSLGKQNHDCSRHDCCHYPRCLCSFHVWTDLRGVNIARDCRIDIRSHVSTLGIDGVNDAAERKRPPRGSKWGSTSLPLLH